MQALIWGCKVDSPTIPDRLGSTFTSIYLTPWARKCALILILKHMKCWRTSENPIQENDFTPSLHDNENPHGMKFYHHLLQPSHSMLVLPFSDFEPAKSTLKNSCHAAQCSWPKVPGYSRPPWWWSVQQLEICALLVGSAITILKNMSKSRGRIIHDYPWWLSHLFWEIANLWNHQPDWVGLW